MHSFPVCRATTGIINRRSPASRIRLVDPQLPPSRLSGHSHRRPLPPTHFVSLPFRTLLDNLLQLTLVPRLLEHLSSVNLSPLASARSERVRNNPLLVPSVDLVRSHITNPFQATGKPMAFRVKDPLFPQFVPRTSKPLVPSHKPAALTESETEIYRGKVMPADGVIPLVPPPIEFR